MKITAIETIQLGEFPNLVWVHVHTDEGLIGLGEAFFGASATAAYIHESAAPRLLGQDPLAIDRHSRTLLGTYVGFSGSGAEMRGLSAIDIALWDLFGQATGQPIHQLLGGLSRPKIRIYNTCAGYRYVRTNVGQLTQNWGLPSERAEGPYEDLDAFLNRADELAQSLLEQGITGMKIWPFDFAAEASDGTYISPSELDQALEPFRKIRKAVGDRMDIMVELHTLWNLPAAKRIFRALEEFEPFWFEDPIKMTSADELAELAASTSVPICASETLATRGGLPRAVRAQRGRGRDARSELGRRPLGSAQDRGHGRDLASAGRPARLHRAGGLYRLGASLDERDQCADSGERARLLYRLVQGAGDRAAADRAGLRLSDGGSRPRNEAPAGGHEAQGCDHPSERSGLRSRAARRLLTPAPGSSSIPADRGLAIERGSVGK